jgi:two-component system chemotaxis response regulator CheB
VDRRFEADASRHLVVVGASAGGVEALCEFVRSLPAGLDAAVCVVLHISPGGTGALAQILDRQGVLPAVTAVDGEALQRGRIYVAPPDHHLLVADGGAVLSVASPEHGHRPAVNPLFRSAAAARGADVIGVILSGAQDDGTTGLAEIVAAGGVALVQDPDEAKHDGMPRSAIDHVTVDATLPVAQIAELVGRLAGSNENAFVD